MNNQKGIKISMHSAGLNELIAMATAGCRIRIRILQDS